MRKRVQISVVHGGSDDLGGTVVLKIDGRPMMVGGALSRRSDAVRSAKRLYESLGRPRGVQLDLPKTDRKAA